MVPRPLEDRSVLPFPGEPSCRPYSSSWASSDGSSTAPSSPIPPHTPCNVYLDNVLLANCVHSLLLDPVDVLAKLSQPWRIDHTACTFSLINLTVAVINAHALVALSRTWTIIHPISCRAPFTRRVAVLSVAAVWAWVVMLNAPVWVGAVTSTTVSF
ncbi:hypothetical protein BV898_17375 [Hypsibius exemplaris]|uniref:G-protein coupled receptors family 1 profile domain-containing protein n=1 Tax=Hypsibius exemplaris TaxID=2072580 RepID=A0A9X6NH50_HYPEX|nr:hypothetical protein BV898_17375 [Hypsibius exemplaris]